MVKQRYFNVIRIIKTSLSNILLYLTRILIGSPIDPNILKINFVQLPALKS